MKYIQTVCGQISPEKLGKTITHEHIRMDYASCYLETKSCSESAKTGLGEERITLDNMRWIQQYPYSSKFNLALNGESFEGMVEEVMDFKNHGGSTIVEATTIGISPDWDFLKRVAQETNVNIVAGTGHYLEESLDEETKNASVYRLIEILTLDIHKGRNGVLPGVIGEIGCSYPLLPAERKCLEAAARTQMRTGYPLLIHPGRHEDSPFEIIDIIRECGGDINKTVMSHLDRTIADYDRLIELAKTGCYIEYDLFGIEKSEYQHRDDCYIFPGDLEKIKRIQHLVNNGYGDKIVISHDIHTRHRLVKYGGHGYGYILAVIVPQMLEMGFSEEQVNKIIVENPKTWLSIESKEPGHRVRTSIPVEPETKKQKTH